MMKAGCDAFRVSAPAGRA